MFVPRHTTRAATASLRSSESDTAEKWSSLAAPVVVNKLHWNGGGWLRLLLVVICWLWVVAVVLAVDVEVGFKWTLMMVRFSCWRAYGHQFIWVRCFPGDFIARALPGAFKFHVDKTRYDTTELGTHDVTGRKLNASDRMMLKLCKRQGLSRTFSPANLP